MSQKDVQVMLNKVLAPSFNLISLPEIKMDHQRYVFKTMLKEQIALLNYLEEQNEAVINGMAGTGKTVMAIEKAKKHADKGEKVLFLCYNLFLKEYLYQAYQNENIDYYTIDGLACKLCDTKEADYEKLIQQTRDDIGYDLSWIVARVSYAWNGYNNKDKMELITSTQASLANNYNVFVGPTTDDMLDDYRSSIDHLHMSEKGLVEHGSRWADAVIKYFCTPYALKADSSMTHGKVNQCSENLYGGQKVTLTATADEGYYLVPGSFKVTNEDGEEIPLDKDSFIMRAEDGLTVSAQFAELPAYLKNLLTVVNRGKSINTSLYPSDKAADIALLNSAIAAGEKVIAAVGTEAEATKAAADIEAAIAKVGPLGQVTPTPAPTAAPTQAPDVTQAPVDTSAPDTIVKGYKYTKSGVIYKVTSIDKLTVSVVGLAKKSAKSSAIVIPASVKISGKTYKVTAIEKNAFKNLPKLKKLTIKATTITSVAKKAFVKVNAKVKVKVPAKKLKAYTKLLVKGGLKKKTIGK